MAHAATATTFEIAIRRGYRSSRHVARAVQADDPEGGMDAVPRNRCTLDRMAVTDDLLRNAYEDTELLKKNDALGDNFSIARDVDFVIKTPDRAKAEIIRSFAEDNQYGVARVEEGDGEFRVLVVINMPITQHVLCSVSALMACLAALFRAEYDGWGCTIQRSM
jgi:hypothetical protein